MMSARRGGARARYDSGMAVFDATALTRLRRVGAIDPSPDGSWLAVSVQRLGDDDAYVSDLWRVSARGGDARALTDGASKDTQPRFGAAGLYFLSDRAGGERAQIWLLPAGGGDPVQVTDEPLGVTAFVVAGETIVLLAEVIAGVPLAEQRARAEDRAKHGPSAIRYRELPVRHWDHWRPDTGLHAILHRDGARVDLTPDAEHELRNPPHDPAFDLSPDGARVALAWSRLSADRNFDAHVRVIETGTGAAIDLGIESDTSIGELRFAPDGRRIAATRPVRRRGKADVTRLWIYEPDRAPRRVHDWDAAPRLQSWTRDGSALLVTADDDFATPVFRVDATSGEVARVTGDGGVHDHVHELPDGRIAGVRSTITHPPEPFACDGSGAPQLLASISGLSPEAGRAIARVERRDTPGAGGTPIGWLYVRPASGDNHAALLWIHGGPIGQHVDGWHWRWNALVAAGAGYAVALPNPRGSTGRGQDFMDGVQDNRWGADCYDDLMAVADALAREPAVDPARVVAMGGSFGGYMANWIGTQTDRFRAIVTHASIFGMASFHGTTDYPAWFALEMGTTPYADAAAFARYSPQAHVGAWKTPTLILHGEKDYRVPISEGLMLFEALRLHGVDAEMVVFPDENHWIQKPRNIRAWYGAWMEFLARKLEQP